MPTMTAATDLIFCTQVDRLAATRRGHGANGVSFVSIWGPLVVESIDINCSGTTDSSSYRAGSVSAGVSKLKAAMETSGVFSVDVSGVFFGSGIRGQSDLGPFKKVGPFR